MTSPLALYDIHPPRTTAVLTRPILLQRQPARLARRLRRALASWGAIIVSTPDPALWTLCPLVQGKAPICCPCRSNRRPGRALQPRPFLLRALCDLYGPVVKDATAISRLAWWSCCPPHTDPRQHPALVDCACLRSSVLGACRLALPRLTS